MPEDVKVPRASPEELEREAVVTSSDRARAPRFWGAYGTPLFRALLAAVRLRRADD